MEARAVDSFYKRMSGQLGFKIKKYAHMFVSNLDAYETGEPEKQVALRPTEIKDPQIQKIFVIGAGLCLVEKDLTFKSQKETQCPREQAVKDLLFDLYSGTASRLLVDRAKVKKVKDECFDHRSSGFPQEASFQAGYSTLKKSLKDLEKNPVSKCVSREDAEKCKNVLKKILDCLRHHRVPKDLENRLEKITGTEIEGLLFYMVYLNFWAALSKAKNSHESKNFRDALDACEKGCAKMKEILKAPPETKEPPEKKRRDEDPAHQTETSSTSHPTNIQSLPLVDPQKTEGDVRDRSQCSRHFIKVKSTPEQEVQEKILSQEEQLASLEQEVYDEKSRTTKAETELSNLERTKAQCEKETAKLEEDVQTLNDMLGEEEDKLSREENRVKELQSEADMLLQLQDAVERLQKQIDEMVKRHQVECNELKADVTAKASKLQTLQKRLYEEAQKRLAENSQVEQLSDPNRPSEVAKRYGDLFQKTYDVAEVLEDIEIDEDECNRFIVDMLIVSSNAAKKKFAEYERKDAVIYHLSEEDNQTAKRTVTCLLRLASATRKKEDSEYITKTALEEVKKGFPKYHVQETAAAIREFLFSASPITWEVAISLRETDFVLDDETFDEALHERFTGSDPNAKNVKSIVWPRLAERFTGKTLCKGRVVTGL